ncbi:hypothetical protein CERZMDRAFT_46467, partial [Cercospora zeae-maydis SCOH1-5]
MTTLHRLLAAFSALPLGLAVTPTTEGNGLPQWLAKLPDNKNVTGNVTVSQGPGGNGVSVQAYFLGLPADGGPFVYHIHEKPISSDWNCSVAGPHLSPYTSDYPCKNISHPETCEAGDLSGKHGNFTDSNFTASYIENYVSNNDAPGCGQCMTNRSLVLHFANQTAIACANFTLIGMHAASGSSVGSPSGSGNGQTT